MHIRERAFFTSSRNLALHYANSRTASPNDSRVGKVIACRSKACKKIRVGVEWRFLGLKRLLPSGRGLAVAAPAGGERAAGVAGTRPAQSGPVWAPHRAWHAHEAHARRPALVRSRASASPGCARPPASGASLAGSPGVARLRAPGRLAPSPHGAGCRRAGGPSVPGVPSPGSCPVARPSAWSA